MGIVLGLLDYFIKKKIKQQNDNFDKDAYDNYNKSKIKEFTDKYDLSTKEGIMSIPISEATKYTDVNQSVVFMPEQILMRKATEYKKANNYEMAIICLRKSNELLKYSPFSYTRKDYERLVDMMVIAGKYDEARQEHKKLNDDLGTRLDELHTLQNFAVQTNSESRESYQKRIIDPYIEEETDREHYYWLLEHKPKLAPKSFGSYRRMKNQNSNTYKEIINEIIKDGYDLNDVTFWL